MCAEGLLGPGAEQRDDGECGEAGDGGERESEPPSHPDEVPREMHRCRGRVAAEVFLRTIARASYSLGPNQILRLHGDAPYGDKAPDLLWQETIPRGHSSSRLLQIWPEERCVRANSVTQASLR